MTSAKGTDQGHAPPAEPVVLLPAAEAGRGSIGGRFMVALRWLQRWERHLIWRTLSHGQFVVLRIWYLAMGPPRVLNFSPDLNLRLLRAHGAHIGRTNIRVLSPVTLHAAEGGFGNLTIADDCILNGNNFLDLTEPITLERGVSLGPGVVVMTHNAFNGNRFLEARLAKLVGHRPVHIKAGAGIKANAVILHGVTIGEEAVVAGASVVGRSVPARAYVSGVPAVVRKTLG